MPKSKKSARNQHNKRRALRLEQLEGRQLMAGDVGVDFTEQVSPVTWTGEAYAETDSAGGIQMNRSGHWNGKGISDKRFDPGSVVRFDISEIGSATIVGLSSRGSKYTVADNGNNTYIDSGIYLGGNQAILRWQRDRNLGQIGTFQPTDQLEFSTEGDSSFVIRLNGEELTRYDLPLAEQEYVLDVAFRDQGNRLTAEWITLEPVANVTDVDELVSQPLVGDVAFHHGSNLLTDATMTVPAAGAIDSALADEANWLEDTEGSIDALDVLIPQSDIAGSIEVIAATLESELQKLAQIDSPTLSGVSSTNDDRNVVTELQLAEAGGTVTITSLQGAVGNTVSLSSVDSDTLSAEGAAVAIDLSNVESVVTDVRFTVASQTSKPVTAYAYRGQKLIDQQTVESSERFEFAADDGITAVVIDNPILYDQRGLYGASLASQVMGPWLEVNGSTVRKPLWTGNKWNAGHRSTSLLPANRNGKVNVTVPSPDGVFTTGFTYGSARNTDWWKTTTDPNDIQFGFVVEGGNVFVRHDGATTASLGRVFRGSKLAVEWQGSTAIYKHFNQVVYSAEVESRADLYYGTNIYTRGASVDVNLSWLSGFGGSYRSDRLQLADLQLVSDGTRQPVPSDKLSSANNQHVALRSAPPWNTEAFNVGWVLQTNQVYQHRATGESRFGSGLYSLGSSPDASKYVRFEGNSTRGPVTVLELLYADKHGIHPVPEDRYRIVGASVVVFPGAPRNLIARVQSAGGTYFHVPNNIGIGDSFESVDVHDGVKIAIHMDMIHAQPRSEGFTSGYSEVVSQSNAVWNPGTTVAVQSQVRNIGSESGVVTITVYAGTADDPRVSRQGVFTETFGPGQSRGLWFNVTAPTNLGRDEHAVMTIVATLPDGTEVTAGRIGKRSKERFYTSATDEESGDSPLSPDEQRRLERIQRKAAKILATSNDPRARAAFQVQQDRIAAEAAENAANSDQAEASEDEPTPVIRQSDLSKKERLALRLATNANEALERLANDSSLDPRTRQLLSVTEIREDLAATIASRFATRSAADFSTLKPKEVEASVATTLKSAAFDTAGSPHYAAHAGLEDATLVALGSAYHNLRLNAAAEAALAVYDFDSLAYDAHSTLACLDGMSSRNPLPSLNNWKVAGIPGGGMYYRDNAAAFAIEGMVGDELTLLVAFRGTATPDWSLESINDTIRDWTQNIVSIDSHYSLFHDFILRVSDHIARTNYDRVLVTGHSLGGAMAQLFMHENPLRTDFQAVTFGSPGALNHDASDSRILNIVHTGDPVTWIGPHRDDLLATATAKLAGLFTPVSFSAEALLAYLLKQHVFESYNRSGTDVPLNANGRYYIDEHSMALYTATVRQVYNVELLV